MKNYQEWYEKRKSSLLRHPQLLQLMRVFNRMMTVLMPLAYLTLLGTNFVSKGIGKDLSAYILVPAFGFVLLTLVRKWINQPRPYETWGIVPLLDKDSSGNSMPSRQCLFSNHHFHGLPACKSSCGVGFVGLISSSRSCSSFRGCSLSQGCFSWLRLWPPLGNSLLYFVKAKQVGLAS